MHRLGTMLSRAFYRQLQNGHSAYPLREAGESSGEILCRGLQQRGSKESLHRWYSRLVFRISENPILEPDIILMNMTHIAKCWEYYEGIVQEDCKEAWKSG